MSDDRLERGLEVRKAVLGAEHVAKARARASEFTGDYQTFLTEMVWGTIWTREGLDRKTRSMLTIAILAALGRTEELRLHIGASRNTGVTREELKEVLLHTAVYAGIPAANSAFHIAADVLAGAEADG